jgi:hypothetical protein
MAALVIGALLLLLLLILYRMARDPSSDDRMIFLADLLATIPEAMRDRAEPARAGEPSNRVKNESAFFGRSHHRHRFGV